MPPSYVQPNTSGERLPNRPMQHNEALVAGRRRIISRRMNIISGLRTDHDCVPDNHTSRLHWSRQFRPGKPTGTVTPDVQKQPCQPQLSCTLEPLRKVLASAGIASYQKCRSIVLGGHVTVNGIPERHPQRMVHPERDKIFVKGRVLEPGHEHLYFLIHKPPGVLSSIRPTSDEHMESLQEVVQLLLLKTKRPLTNNMHLVWRLGVLSSGLQLVTSDLNWAREVMASSHAQLSTLRHGSGSERMLLRRVVMTQVHTSKKLSRLCITMSKGRCADLHARLSDAGLPCLELKRTRMGGLMLDPSMPAGAGSSLSRWQIKQVVHTDAARSAILNSTPYNMLHQASTTSVTVRVAHGPEQCLMQSLLV